MSRFHGAQFKGASKVTRDLRRAEAEARQAVSDPKNSKRYRLDPSARLLVDVFLGVTRNAD